MRIGMGIGWSFTGMRSGSYALNDLSKLSELPLHRALPGKRSGKCGMSSERA